MRLEELDRLPEREARAALARCCGAARWLDAMLAARPFGSRAALLAAAERADAALAPADWREAFAHHPRIGEPGAGGWARAEQAGAAAASPETLAALAAGNRDYERRFGHAFIVCATGRGAAEMLAMLRARLANEPARELAVAADEQARITRLRLDKLLAAGG